MNKAIWGTGALALMVLGGCAKDRTVDEYRRDRVAAEEAAMDEVKGTYRGAYLADDGTPIGAIAIQVVPDRTSAPSASAPAAEQQAVLEVRVTLNGRTPKTLTFNNGSYDRAAKQFHAVASVTGRGNAELKGTFADNELTGKLEVDGYPDRGGSFDLVRDAPFPTFVSATRAEQEDDFLFKTFSAIAKFSDGPSANPEDDRVHLTVLRPLAVNEQTLMDVITPYRTLDLSVYFNAVSSDGTHRTVGGQFTSSTWDIRSGTLRGTYSVPGGPGVSTTLLNLVCTQTAVGWNCQELSSAAGVIFSADFVPEAGQ